MGTAENDIKFRALAKRLIGDNGKLVQFNNNVATYDPETDLTTFGADDFKSVKISPPARYTEDQITGEIVQQGDLRALVARTDLEDAGFEIAKQMDVVIDSETWKIESFSPIYSGELIAAYVLQLRK